MSIGGKVNYYFTGILIILITLLALFGGPARGDSTQTNVSGSNTSDETIQYFDDNFAFKVVK